MAILTCSAFIKGLNTRKKGNTSTFSSAKISRFKSAGFTLLEILIVVSVITILSAMLAGYSRQSGRQLLLATTEANLLSLFSRAKFLSIETFFQEADSPGGSKVCAYGVHVDRSAQEIFIFRDGIPELGSCPGDNVYKSGSNDLRLSGEIDGVKLNADVLSLGTGSLDDIVFIPPDPEVVINGSGDTSATLVVNSLSGAGDFTITLNKDGQVKAE